MADGKVIPGGQNDFKPFGEIAVTEPSDEKATDKSIGKKYQRNTITYKKGRVNKKTNRNHNECWSAGTPVTWEDDVKTAKTITVKVPGSIDDMLVTRDPVNKETILEYHPVITFFNEVMAQMLRDGLRKVISKLEEEKNAIKVWDYLNNKYLDGKGKKKAAKKGLIKAGGKKMAAVKMRKPLKNGKPVKKGSQVKKK